MAILYRFGIVSTPGLSDRGLRFDKLAFRCDHKSARAADKVRSLAQFAGFEVSNTGSVPVFDTLEP
jgi:hypothetical protein